MELKDYQETGVRFILERRATLLADEMGLGKTAETIVAFGRSQCERLTVVCPAYLRMNWQREIDTWLGVRRDKFIPRIVSYDSLETMPLNEEDDGDFLVIDEGHYVKNTNSLRYKNVEAVAKKAKKLVVITGTPVPDRVRDLFALLCIIEPMVWDPPLWNPFANLPPNVLLLPPEGKKPPSYNRNFLNFARRYCGAQLKPIDGLIGRNAYDFDGASNLNELHQRLKPIMLRRTKKEVLTELPPKRRQLIVLPATTDMLRADIDDIVITEDNYDVVIHRLQSDPVLFRKWSETRHFQARKKVPHILDHLQTCLAAGADKVIVFGHHTDVLEELFAVLMFDGAVMVTGKDKEVDRQDAIDVFQQDPMCRFFVGSIGACGVGINLTAASHVVFAELDPSPHRISQCEDRAHRLGQRRMVLAQHIVWNGTLDARMAQIVVRKQEAINALMG